MEKHCERQHSVTPPGGRGQYIDTTSAELSAGEELQRISHFQSQTYSSPQQRRVLVSPGQPRHIIEGEPEITQRPLDRSVAR